MHERKLQNADRGDQRRDGLQDFRQLGAQEEQDAVQFDGA